MNLKTLLLCALLFAGSAKACFVPPYNEKHTATVAARSADAVAIVYFGKNGESLDVRIESMLRGNRNEVKIDLEKVIPISLDEFLERRDVNHESTAFWAGRETSSAVYSDCSVRTRVAIGVPYLYLQSNGPSAFTLEPILSESDEWLIFLKSNEQIATPMTLSQYLQGAAQVEFVHCATESSDSECWRYPKGSSFLKVVFDKSQPYYFQYRKGCFDLSPLTKRLGIKLKGRENMQHCPLSPNGSTLAR